MRFLKKKLNFEEFVFTLINLRIYDFLMRSVVTLIICRLVTSFQFSHCSSFYYVPLKWWALWRENYLIIVSLRPRTQLYKEQSLDTYSLTTLLFWLMVLNKMCICVFLYASVMYAYVYWVHKYSMLLVTLHLSKLFIPFFPI